MKVFTLLAGLLALAPFALPVAAETRDPAPVVADEPTDDGRHPVGLFDFVRPAKTACENGVCRVVGPTVAPTVATAAAAPATAYAARQPVRALLHRVRTWYPGKLFQTVRANFAAARGR